MTRDVVKYRFVTPCSGRITLSGYWAYEWLIPVSQDEGSEEATEGHGRMAAKTSLVLGVFDDDVKAVLK
jgi:hypothetical protein